MLSSKENASLQFKLHELEAPRQVKEVEQDNGELQLVACPYCIGVECEEI